jgi:3-hydroxybutyrate dehydrogenase
MSLKGPSLKGKVALVTGSTSGIGLGIAQTLAAEGADIMLNGFGAPEAIQAAIASVTALGVQAGYDGANLMQPEGSASLVAKTHATLGALDILVNNAGIQHTATIAEFPPEKWDAVIALNLSAPFHCMQAAIPGMVAKGWGRIINIASAHGLVASATKAAYVAAKHGLIGLTKVGAIELANTGITVNAICPGWVLTPLVQAQIDARAKAAGRTPGDEARLLLIEKQPMEQFTTPEGLGALAVFLCSDGACTMTGASLSMDGGWVAQ